MSENKRRNRGPEHIREILKAAKKEWCDNNTRIVKQNKDFQELEENCPKFYQIVFLYIDSDPIYIRTINLN